MLAKVLRGITMFTFSVILLSAQTQTSGSASQTSGSVSGKVTDTAGRGVSGAVVRFQSAGSTVASATTGADGSFTVPDLAPGTYSVVLESSGVTLTNPGTVTVGPDGTSPFQFTFARQTNGSTGGELVVKADAPNVQTQSTESSRAYEGRLVQSLPLLDRQNQDLIGLMPGVSPPAVTLDPVEDPQHRRSINVNGLPAWANNYNQDGSFQTEMFTAKPSRVAPNASVQQLNVVTSNFNGEHGYAGGSWINTVTRPGTTRLHGSGFYLYSGGFLTARNPMDAQNTKPNFNQNQFGGSVGGPIIKDKTFLFGSYEGFLRRGSQFQITSVPTEAFRSGNFSALGTAIYDPATGTTNRTPFTGNQIPSTSFNPVARALLNYLPLPNGPGLFNNLSGGVPLIEDLHRMDGKLDHRFSERSTGFFRYGFTHGSVNRGSLLGALGNPAEASLRNHNAVASLTYSVTPTLAGEFRAGYSRYRNALGPWGDFAGLNNSLLAAGFQNGLPQININGFGGFGFPGNYPSKGINNTYNLGTTWTWHNGMHNIKFGLDAVHYRVSGFDAGPFSPRGTFSFSPGPTTAGGQTPGQFDPAANAFAAFLTGAPALAGTSSFTQTPTYQQTLVSGFVTDTMNLWSKLYLELGLRYDVFTPLQTRNSLGATIYDPATNQITPSSQTYTGIFPDASYDLNNFAPRVGIAFRPIERVVFRAGYGIHYFAAPIATSVINQSAIASQVGIVGGTAAVPFVIPVTSNDPNATTAPNQPFYVPGSSDMRTPYVQTYSAMVQADVGAGIMLDVGYVGNIGRKMPYSLATNIALPGAGLAGLPGAAFNRTAQTTLRGNGANSNFNSFQVNVTKRFTGGLSLAGAYTWGKVLDTGFEQANPFDRRGNYGPADWDRTHMLAISHLWQLPFGPGTRYFISGLAAWLLGSWELNGILQWATGTPYSITADPLSCACPGVTSQPALYLGTGNFNGNASFDPSLFSSPAAATFGTQGRNAFRGPDFFTYNLALFKTFPIGESYKFELRGEAYNITNSSNYMHPTSSFGLPGFGMPMGTYNGIGGRQFQVGGRILF